MTKFSKSLRYLNYKINLCKSFQSIMECSDNILRNRNNLCCITHLNILDIIFNVTILIFIVFNQFVLNIRYRYHNDKQTFCTVNKC